MGRGLAVGRSGVGGTIGSTMSTISSLGSYGSTRGHRIIEHVFKTTTISRVLELVRLLRAGCEG